MSVEFFESRTVSQTRVIDELYRLVEELKSYIRVIADYLSR